MKTYKTYQEAKIANPNSDIYHADSIGFVSSDAQVTAANWKKCNPADYCMTVEKFLANGHKFEVGDLILGTENNIAEVGNHYSVVLSNEICESDKERFVLRAAALEHTETPKEKESFDVIAQDNEAANEWSVGDKCVVGNEKTFLSLVEDYNYLIGQEATVIYTFKNSNNYNMAVVEFSDGACFAFTLDKLSKPITEREAFIKEFRRLIPSGDIFKFDFIAEKMFESGRFKLNGVNSSKLKSRIRSVAEWEINTCGNYDWESVSESIYCAVDDLLNK